MKPRLLRSLLMAFAIWGIVMTALGGAYAIVTAVRQPDLIYRSMDYDVRMLRNGDLRVRQRVTMRLRNRYDGDEHRPWKQLFQQYRLTDHNLTSISDISVTNVTQQRRYDRTDPQNPSGISDGQWDSQYANHWYVADVTYSDAYPEPYDPDGSSGGDRTIEIGWNIPATGSADNLTFDIEMTMHGVSTAYRDVTAFQWEPFGKDNQVPIGTVTGTVSFPDGVDESTSWAWLHFAGNGRTERGENGELRFTAYDVRAGQYLDLVAMVDGKATSGVVRTDDSDHKRSLIDSETSQERQWNDRQRMRAVALVVIWVVLSGLCVAAMVYCIVVAVRSKRRSTYRGDIEYWREPPEMSPASAGMLMGILDGDSFMTDSSSRQMSATVLSLASKGAIVLYPGSAERYVGIDLARSSARDIAGLAQRRPGGTDTSTVVINPVVDADRASLRLCPSEDAALSLLQAAAQRVGSPVFDLNQMSAAFQGWSGGYRVHQRYEAAAQREFSDLRAVDVMDFSVPLACVAGVVSTMASCGLFFALGGGLVMSLLISAPTLFVAVFCACYGRMTGLSDAGQRYAGQVLGLRRYLEDFSDFSDRGTADLVLWDRYLVYATAFGMSGTVLRQLSQAKPELLDPEWMDGHGGSSLLYWAYRPMLWGAGWQGGSAMGSALPDIGDSAFGGFSDLGQQLDSGFASVRNTIQQAAPSGESWMGGFSGSGGSFSGSSFGGSFGGSGGGSFGGR